MFVNLMVVLFILSRVARKIKYNLWHNFYTFASVLPAAVLHVYLISYFTMRHQN